MQSRECELSDFAAVYLNLSPRRKKIVQYLFVHQKKYKNTFPKISSIAKFSGLSERAVQKFFAFLDETKANILLITKKSRYRPNGSNTTNEYLLNSEFMRALEWLNLRGFLRSPKKKARKILLSMQNEEKIHPYPQEKVTPSYKDSFYKDQHTFKDGVWINPMLKGLGIDPWAVTYASRYASEHIIVDTLEACKWQEKKKKIKNPSSYFMGVLKNKMFKGDKRC